MAKVLFVTGTGPGSGKALVALGLMDLLVASTDRVGFFRPVVASRDGTDQVLEMVAGRYSLNVSTNALYGVTANVARSLMGEGTGDKLMKQVLERYKAIESQFDVVLCLGPDFSGGDCVPRTPVRSRLLAPAGRAVGPGCEWPGA